MAEGKRPGCKIVHRRGTSVFHLQLCLSSPEDPRPANGFLQHAEVVVAGCKCTAYCMFGDSDPKHIMLSLKALYDPAAKVSVSTHMVLLDKTGSPATSIGTELERREGFYSLLAAWDDVKANCVVEKDNHLVVLCSVDIDRTPSVSSSLEEVLPDLGHDLAMMSDKQEFTDVSFDVAGESFRAHRLVLAARSPVFKAQSYGDMAEGNTASITVEDMEASTFRSMLHCMYHGSLSDVSCNMDVSSTMAQCQHLLVAADRYGVEGLKKICVDKLCGKGITVDSVVSMLELAEDHACPKLKARCFDFLADGDNFKMVGISDEYISLIQSFPNLLVEVRNRIKKALEESSTLNPGAHKKSRVC